MKKRTQVLTLLVIVFAVVSTYRSFSVFQFTSDLFYGIKAGLGLILILAGSGLLIWKSRASWWVLVVAFGLGLVLVASNLIRFTIASALKPTLVDAFPFALALVLLLSDRPSRWERKVSKS